MINDAYGNTRFFGIYRGVVYDVSDPLNQNRIRVQIPQLLAGQPTSWAWPGSSVSAVPNVGDGVFVQFESGDPAYPLWTGVFASKTPPSTTTPTTVTSTIIDGGSA